MTNDFCHRKTMHCTMKGSHAMAEMPADHGIGLEFGLLLTDILLCWLLP